MSNFYGRMSIAPRAILPPRCTKISGQVTLGVGQVGALVNCVDEQDLTFVGQTTTDSSGNYVFAAGFAIKADHTYHLTAQYDNGAGSRYNSLSQPYVQPVEN